MSDFVLDGKFLFRQKDDGSLDKTVVSCRYCDKIFNYHQTASSLRYHLRNKHPFVNLGETFSASASTAVDVDTTDAPQPSASSGVRVASVKRQSTLPSLMEPKKAKLLEDKRDAITNAILIWLAKYCRPLNAGSDDGLQHMIRVAASDDTYRGFFLSLRPHEISLCMNRMSGWECGAAPGGHHRSLEVRRKVILARQGAGVEKKLGRPMVLSGEAEAELNQILRDMESRLYGLTPIEVRRKAE